MDDILVHDEAEIAANRAGGGIGGVSGSHERPALGHGAFAGHLTIFTTGPGRDVGHESLVERLATCSA